MLVSSVFLTRNVIHWDLYKYKDYTFKRNMEVGEAVVISASQGPEGAQEVEFKAVCSAANCED